MNRLLTLCALALVTTNMGLAGTDYVGFRSSEAIMSYTASIEKQAQSLPSESEARKAIENQIEHLTGPMSLASRKANLRGDYTISDILFVSQEGSTYRFTYKFEGLVAIQDSSAKTYELTLPVNPETIYKASLTGRNNPCTDDHYQSEGDFWYFWSPKRPGCRLKEGRDYLKVDAQIERIENTKISYPEYHNLPDASGLTTVHMFFGLNEPNQNRNARMSSDINGQGFRDFRKFLLRNKYQARKWSRAEIKEIAKTTDGKMPYVESFKKGNIEYRIFFGATGIDEDSLAFHWFFKDAIENASIMIYSGHSGLGGHMDLESIEENIGTKINFNTDRYQIFFFDSCSSYRYYNKQYFSRKVSADDVKGTKKLDIIANGLSTLFTAIPIANRVLATALEDALNKPAPAYTSYQDLVSAIDSNNLFGINGDEDNEIPNR